MSMSFEGSAPSTQAVLACAAQLEALAEDAALAFTALRTTAALADAQAVDTLCGSGAAAMPLQGEVFGVKACFDVQGWVTHAGSKVLAGSAPAAVDAPLVAQLRHAGAVLLGQNNMTEFAYGALGQNDTYGTPRCTTLTDVERVAGGSSSGGAVAVSRGMQSFALGSDTSGSARIPAAFCGVVGFKPSRHRYADAGLLKLSSSFDVPGILARDVATCARVDAVLATPATLPPEEPPQPQLLVVPAQVLDLLDADVRAAFRQVMAQLTQCGYRVETRELPSWHKAPAVARAGAMIAAEAYVAHQALLSSSLADYSPRVGPRILAGRQVLAADYLSASQALAQLRADFALELGAAAAVLSPTVPMKPPPVQALQDLEQYLALNARAFVLTEPANRLDLPSISLPLPGHAGLGLMLTARSHADLSLLALAQRMQAQLQPIAISDH